MKSLSIIFFLALANFIPVTLGSCYYSCYYGCCDAYGNCANGYSQCASTSNCAYCSYGYDCQTSSYCGTSGYGWVIGVIVAFAVVFVLICCITKAKARRRQQLLQRNLLNAQLNQQTQPTQQQVTMGYPAPVTIYQTPNQPPPNPYATNQVYQAPPPPVYNYPGQPVQGQQYAYQADVQPEIYQGHVASPQQQQQQQNNYYPPQQNQQPQNPY